MLCEFFSDGADIGFNVSESATDSILVQNAIVYIPFTPDKSKELGFLTVLFYRCYLEVLYLVLYPSRRRSHLPHYQKNRYPA